MGESRVRNGERRFLEDEYRKKERGRPLKSESAGANLQKTIPLCGSHI